MSLLEPIEQIIGTHHAYLRRVLPEILRKIQAAPEIPESEAGVRLRKNFDSLSEELHKHMLKEEVLLFPSLLEVERCVLEGAELDLKRHDIQNPLDQMEYEHSITENFLSEIHEAGAQLEWEKDFPEIFQRVKELEADLLSHIKLEEENLFAEARKLYVRVLARQAR